MFVEITIRKKYFHESLKDTTKESHPNTVKDENILFSYFRNH